jgi:hypothetical protein
LYYRRGMDEATTNVARYRRRPIGHTPVVIHHSGSHFLRGSANMKHETDNLNFKQSCNLQPKNVILISGV